ncbi:MAG: FAD-dependent oxidoreductase, partial [Bacteroidota bacterium]
MKLPIPVSSLTYDNSDYTIAVVSILAILKKNNIILSKASVFKLFITIMFCLSSCETGVQDKKSTDLQTGICVYGGTAAGVMASIQVAKMGAKVLLIAPEKHLGGMSVNGLGGSDINNHKGFKNDEAIGGLALEFYTRVAAHYGNTLDSNSRKGRDIWRFESSVAEKIIGTMLSEYDINILKHERIISEPGAVALEGKRITKIKLESGKVITAKYFIDASLEGDLLYRAGISTYIGREGNDQYGETKNGIREENTYRQFTVSVDPYIIPGNAESGLIPTIQGEPLGIPGAADHRIQAYCFRACLTNNEENRVPFIKPVGYDPGQYEIYLRYIEAGGNLYKPRVNLPNRKTDLGAWHDLSHNLYGMNHDYPGGNYVVRDSIIKGHLTFTQGLFYFLANDSRVPKAIRSEWSKWGTTKDEFVDNDGWPHIFYIREARRMVSDYVITEHHTKGDTAVAVIDPVAMAYWPPDTHHVRRIVKDGVAYNEGFVFGGDDWAPFGISYQSLVPKKEECINLITPTCLSSTHVAYGAIRLEWTFMALGQAAGTAAVIAFKDEIPIQNVPYSSLKSSLLAGNQ